MSLTQWSDYWAAGNLTSLPNDFQHNYDGEIKEFWFKIFATLQENASILDVCTGNGAVAYLAQSYADIHNKDWQIVAVDGAEIRQDKVSERHQQAVNTKNKIEFISNVLIEELELKNKDFDLIISQYGIEYCDWEMSSASILKHLADAGQLAFLTHAPETDISEQMRREKDLYRFIDRLSVFDTIAKFLDGRLNFAQMQKINKKQQSKLQSKWQHSQSPLIKGFLDYSSFMLNVTSNQLSEVTPQIKSFFNQHNQAYQRLLDIVGVANRIKNNPDWYRVFERDGIRLASTTNVRYQGQHLAGIGYEFLRDGTA